MWQKLLCTVLLLILGASVGLATISGAIAEPDVPGQSKQADIQVFVREGCSHCAKAKAFLDQLKQEFPGLNIEQHEISGDPGALETLRVLAEKEHVTPRVPAFFLNGQLIVGFLDADTTGKMIRDALSVPAASRQHAGGDGGSCEAEESLSCEGAPATPVAAAQTSDFEIEFLGHRLSVEEVGLPLFTLAMGLLDGFNPCSMWVLILMISLLAPMNQRIRMLAVAGTFVAVEGIAYFIFMAAWLNLFLLIGLSRASEIVIAAIAILAGSINLKDFVAYGWGGISLSIPDAAKPGIYARMRRILQAENLWGAMIGAVVLAILVQIVEFLCTSGFPALYTRILTLRHLEGAEYYGYLLLYNVAYMFDDVLVLGVGVITLSQRRLQEKEGRWLKLISGLVMVSLGIYLLLNPSN
ncbi:glutaredoxin family protein [Methyloterricola oryzae]|uniref:glutaredoxin family protein n=1 Tax=Methyloterricola oryzae TaxID=1495050 RepID=UPI000A6D2268|nr:glutaredoxin [Methyloterricola oryzae]